MEANRWRLARKVSLGGYSGGRPYPDRASFRIPLDVPQDDGGDAQQRRDDRYVPGQSTMNPVEMDEDATLDNFCT